MKLKEITILIKIRLTPKTARSTRTRRNWQDLAAATENEEVPAHKESPDFGHVLSRQDHPGEVDDDEEDIMNESAPGSILASREFFK